MIAFINTFLSYLLVVIVFLAIITVAVILGKKLRENKDAKDAAALVEAEKENNSNEV